MSIAKHVHAVLTRARDYEHQMVEHYAGNVELVARHTYALGVIDRAIRDIASDDWEVRSRHFANKARELDAFEAQEIELRL